MTSAHVSPAHSAIRLSHYRIRHWLITALLLLVVALGSVIFALPFVWMI